MAIPTESIKEGEQLWCFDSLMDKSVALDLLTELNAILRYKDLRVQDAQIVPHRFVWRKDGKRTVIYNKMRNKILIRFVSDDRGTHQLLDCWAGKIK